MKGERLKELVVKKEKRNSQGKDPRTFDGNSRGWGPQYTQSKQVGKGPKNLQRTSGKVASSEEAKGEEVKEKEEKKKVKYRRSSWW